MEPGLAFRLWAFFRNPHFEGEAMAMLSKARRSLLSRLAFELIKIDFAMLIVGPFLKLEIFQWWLVGVGIIMLIALLTIALIFEEG